MQAQNPQYERYIAHSIALVHLTGKTLLYSVARQELQITNIVVPMLQHTDGISSRDITTYTKETRPLSRRKRDTMLKLVTLSATHSTLTSWFLTSGRIPQTSRYVLDTTLPPLHHLPYFASLRNPAASLYSIENFFC